MLRSSALSYSGSKLANRSVLSFSNSAASNSGFLIISAMISRVPIRSGLVVLMVT